tara:strand:+ start:321 stop:1100 length:780 start_codon:yes stop_codon:yes gene_type:complete
MPPTPPTSAATLVLRPTDERFHTQLDWLDSWHSFSFGHHYDPAWMGFGPLLVINDDTIAAGRGFGMHPHRNMEIITVMVEGELTHADSIGHCEVLRAGEVQRMSAGTGIVHSEINKSSQPCRFLQIWIEPEQIGITPDYDQKPIAIGTGWTTLIHPDAPSDAMATASATRMWRARPNPQADLPLPAATEHSLWIQVIDGELELRNDNGSTYPLKRGDGVGIVDSTTGTHTLVGMNTTADVLLLALNNNRSVGKQADGGR